MMMLMPSALLQADVQEDRAAFASMPFAEGVTEVLAALSKEWLTEEEIAAPVEEPEEWTPEVGFDMTMRLLVCIRVSQHMHGYTIKRHLARW
jgi:hypothetical protein